MRCATPQYFTLNPTRGPEVHHEFELRLNEDIVMILLLYSIRYVHDILLVNLEEAYTVFIVYFMNVYIIFLSGIASLISSL